MLCPRASDGFGAATDAPRGLPEVGDGIRVARHPSARVECSLLSLPHESGGKKEEFFHPCDPLGVCAPLSANPLTEIWRRRTLTKLLLRQFFSFERKKFLAFLG